MSINKINMDIKAQQLNIVLKIPFQNENIPLTLDVIYHPEIKNINKAQLSKHPYITSKIRYPHNLVTDISSKGYSNIISFFFQKDIFENSLRNTRPEKINDENTESMILEHNIMAMLLLLFPTYHPSFQNVSDSYNKYILKKQMPLSMKSLRKMSYIQINGKVYSVTNTVYLNDLVNHPIYRDVINKYIKFFEWSNSKNEEIDKEIINNFNKLLDRFNNENELSIRKSVISKLVIPPSAQPRTLDIINQVNSNITDMNNKISEIYSDSSLNIKTFYDSIVTVQNIYKAIVSSGQVKQNISDFGKKIDILVKEVSIINTNRIINEQYIQPKRINLKLDDENKEIADVLRAQYKPYIDFIDVIRSILTPNRETKNTLLQNSINMYSENKKSTYGFNNIIEKIAYDYMDKNIYSDINVLNMIDLKDYMNVGINSINKNDQTKPQYEIYLAMDLIENEYSPDTIGEIKCIYDGFLLGKEVENMMTNQSIYDALSGRIYLSQEEIKQSLPKPSTSTKPTIKTGGRKSKKYKKHHFTSNIKNKKTRRRRE
jgi:hypothetical protein